MSHQSTPPAKARMIRAGRVLLGMAVGASFGVFLGALVASWVWGVEAIESQKVGASYLAAATTLLGAVVGGLVGFRVGRAGANRSARDSDPSISPR